MNALTCAKDVRVVHDQTFSYVDSPSICVTVGEGTVARDFFIHRGLICPRSEFFNRSMNGNWKEADDLAVPLPEDDSEVFSIYAKLLYTGKLPLKEAISTDHATKVEEYLLLSKLYVLAEKLADQITKGIVLAAISARAEEASPDKSHCFPAIDSIQVIYEGTIEGSPARHLLTQLYTDSNDSTFFTAKADVPKDFLYDLSPSMLRSRSLLRDHEKLCVQHKSLETNNLRLEARD